MPTERAPEIAMLLGSRATDGSRLGMAERNDGERGAFWTLARWAAIASMLAITVLSTLPGTLRPHTGYSGNVEHFIAYAGAAVLIQLGLPKLRRWREVILLSVASAIFEVLQIWIPGRGSGVDNWAASTAGAVAGMMVGLAILRLLGVKLGSGE